MSTSRLTQTTVLAIPSLDGALNHASALPNTLRPKALGAQNLGRAFLDATLRDPTAMAFLSPRYSVTYGELLAAAQHVRDRLLADAALQALGRIVLLLNNSPEYAAAFYGTLLAGGVVVPVPPEATEARLAEICRSCDTKILLTSERIRQHRADVCSWKGDVIRWAERSSRLNGATKDAMTQIDGADALPDDLAAVFFTGGSTGLPKGVMLSHRNLISNSQSICQYLEIDAQERALAVLPFYHAFGNSVLQTHLLSGATLVLDGSLAFPESIFDAIRRHCVTSLSGVPDLFHFLLDRSSLGRAHLPSLRYMAVAGGSLRAELAVQVARRIAPAQLFLMYGQTEATARLSYLPPENLIDHAGSIGKGIPGVELQVVNSEGGLAGVGETGEIRARGPNVMIGYWRDEAATSETVRDGWLYTGDLATVDSQGMIYPLGRRSELIKIRGFRVHSQEIEDAVRHALSVQRLVAVPYQSAEGATRLALFVQPASRMNTTAPEEILRRCAKQLPRHLIPDVVQVLDEFPLNDALKIDRPALSQMAAAAANQQTCAGVQGVARNPPKILKGTS
jgi:long-chain acyl-CoA synthetase